jgi:hypothetical protein
LSLSDQRVRSDVQPLDGSSFLSFANSSIENGMTGSL